MHCSGCAFVLVWSVFLLSDSRQEEVTQAYCYVMRYALFIIMDNGGLEWGLRDTGEEFERNQVWVRAGPGSAPPTSPWHE